MSIQRCPECGGRLNTNYCDICMRKVPFAGMKTARRRDPWETRDGSSAHRMEKDHTCVSFEKPEKQTFRGLVKKQTPVSKKKTAPALGILLAVLSLLPALFGLFEEAAESVAVPEPEYSIYEGFVLAGDPGAEDVPNVIAGEIYNQDGIRITADYAGLSYGDYTLFMTICNDTDRDVGISMDRISVNGYMVPFGLYQDVKAGKSEQTYLTFYSYTLEESGISNVADVEIVLDVYDAKSYVSIAESELLRIETDYSGSTEPAVDVSGMELYYDGSLCVLLRDARMLEQGDCELDLYMENLSGSTVNVYSGAVWVNGEEVSGYIGKILRPNTRAFDNGSIYVWDYMDIEELDQIDEITIDLYVEYMDGDVMDVYSEKITFELNAIV